MQRISLVDETFDLNFTIEYKLSIQLSLDGFSFSILDTIQNKVIYLYYQELFEAEPEFLLKRLKTIYTESDLLELPYKKTQIILVNPSRTTLIPREIYQSQQTDNYLNQAFGRNADREYLASYVKSANYYAIVETSAIISNFLKDKHSDAQFITDLNVSFPAAKQSSKTVKVTIYKKHLSVTGFDQEGLQFHNSFYYDGENDQLYFILGSIQAMTDEPELIIMDGLVNKHTTIYHRLRQYFNKVEIAHSPREIHYSYLFDKLPDSRFVNLFNSFL